MSLGMFCIFVILSELFRARAVEFEKIDLSENGRVNATLASIVSIDEAHNMRKRHRGVWLYIVNEDNEILMLKRPDDVVICPSTWYAPGEHTKYLESYADTAFRGLLEEMRLRAHQILMLKPLFTNPSLVEIEFEEALSTGSGILQQKHDAQWTQSFLVRVLKSTVHKRNREAVAMEWVPLQLLEQWANNKTEESFCQVKRFTFSNQ